MQQPNGFEFTDEYAVFRPIGYTSSADAAHMVTRAIEYARINHITKLLLDSSQVTDLEVPTTSTRYNVVHEWAFAAQGKVCLAAVIPPFMVDFEPIGEMVARNLRFTGRSFTSMEDAVEWLRHVTPTGEAPRQVP